MLVNSKDKHIIIKIIIIKIIIIKIKIIIVINKMFGYSLHKDQQFSSLSIQKNIFSPITSCNTIICNKLTSISISSLPPDIILLHKTPITLTLLSNTNQFITDTNESLNKYDSIYNNKFSLVDYNTAECTIPENGIYQLQFDVSNLQYDSLITNELSFIWSVTQTSLQNTLIPVIVNNKISIGIPLLDNSILINMPIENIQYINLNKGDKIGLKILSDVETNISIKSMTIRIKKIN